MTYSEPARPASRRTRSAVLAAVVVIGAALIGVAASPIDILQGDSGPAATGVDDPGKPTTDDHGQHDEHDRRAPARPLGEADGAVPDGVTVFNDELPAVTNLDLGLLQAVREAATDAADDGVTFYINSGWRSAKYQDQLLREAVSEYGSQEEAARWVATADTSQHVSGAAIDIGHSDATAWLSEHGAEYGLCQIYANEPWHYELRPDATDRGCPPMYTDPTQDPRMQQ